MKTYSQYCPIARASEIVAERWTPIILRNLFAGCSTFSQIRAGAPGISDSLLTKRLRELERVGVVERRPKESGQGSTYALTEAGRALKPILRALRDWGLEWVELGEQHTNPALVLWAWTTTYLARDLLPDHRVLVRFEFSDQAGGDRRIWLLVERGDAEACKHHPGGDEDLIIETDTRTFALWHTGRLEWPDARRAGRIRVAGPQALAKALPTWNRRGFTTDPYAA